MINEKSAQLWLKKGNSFKKLEIYEEAEDAYKKALKFNPDFANAWYNLGLVYENQKRFDDAEDSFKKVIEIDENFKNVWKTLGDLYEKQDLTSKTENCHEHLREINKNQKNNIKRSSPNSKPKYDNKKLLKKFKEIIQPQKFKQEFVAKSLGLKKEELLEKLIEWSEILPFKIKGDNIIIENRFEAPITKTKTNTKTKTKTNTKIKKQNINLDISDFNLNAFFREPHNMEYYIESFIEHIKYSKKLDEHDEYIIFNPLFDVINYRKWSEIQAPFSYRDKIKRSGVKPGYSLEGIMYTQIGFAQKSMIPNLKDRLQTTFPIKKNFGFKNEDLLDAERSLNKALDMIQLIKYQKNYDGADVRYQNIKKFKDCKLFLY